MELRKSAVAVAGIVMGLGAAAPAVADAGAGAAAVGSPGVLSGDVVQVPVHLPLNLCGNSVDLVALLNPTFGNACVNA